MSTHCCNHDTQNPNSITNMARYKRILWIALAANAAMFFVEIAAGIQSGSLALLADAVDFAADALNYAISLAVLAAALTWRAKAAIFKAVCMVAFGLYILTTAIWSVWNGQTPEATTMGVVAVMALSVNIAVAWMLYAFREGDANMKSVWLCSRNDAIGNVAVIIAAVGVFGTGTPWPDIIVGAIMALLAMHGGWTVWKMARRELSNEKACGQVRSDQ